jgi:hypothetical protein
VCTSHSWADTIGGVFMRSPSAFAATVFVEPGDKRVSDVQRCS